MIFYFIGSNNILLNRVDMTRVNRIVSLFVNMLQMCPNVFIQIIRFKFDQEMLSSDYVIMKLCKTCI